MPTDEEKKDERKSFKHKKTANNSSLRIVSMSPSNLKRLLDVLFFRNDEIIIYGSGNQIMDFIYVDDLAEILCRALLADHGVYSSVIEAGSGNETTINFIAKKIIELSESSSSLRWQPMRPGEDKNSRVVADVKTLEPLKKTDPLLLTNLHDGLVKTIEYYRENLEIYN